MKPRAPELGPAGRLFWRQVTAAYELSPSETEMLRQAAHTVDVIAWMQRQLEGEPLTTAGSTGQAVPNPLLGALSDQRRTLELLMRSIALPMPDEDTGHRRTPRAVAAAQERWRQQRRQEA